MAEQIMKLHEQLHEIHGHAHNKRMSMRLFMLRHGKGGAPVVDADGNVIYYSSKSVAKQNRGDKQVVSYGIDHRKYRGAKDAS